MERNASHILKWSLVVGVLICLAALVRQNLRTNELIDAQEATANRFASELNTLRRQLDAQEESIGESGQGTTDLRGDIAGLSWLVTRLIRSGGDAEEAELLSEIVDPSVLQPGIYVLAPVAGSSEELDSYTIYHATAAVSAGDFERDIQFGIARAGLFNWQLYFDYNNDGRVDTDMLFEFVDSIPFGGYVSGSVDSERSQAVYDRLLVYVGEAVHIPPDRIDNEGGEIARQMWAFVAGRSEQLAAWVLGRLEIDSTESENELSVE